MRFPAVRRERGPHGKRQGGPLPDKDETQGRIKEAAGDLTGDKDLQREGKVDQPPGKAKNAVDNAADKAKTRSTAINLHIKK